MSTLDYPLVDADAHYYEPYDAWTRYIEPDFRDHAINAVVGDDGVGRIYVGDRRLRFAPSWMIDYAHAPGALVAAFMGGDGVGDIVEPINAREFPAFYRRDERVALLDQQGVQTTIMLPTQGVQVEHDLHNEPDVLYANLRAFNRWIADEWGWNRDGRIVGVASMSLVDPELAAAETERVVAEGARVLYLSPGPVYGRSPADRVYDRFWSIVNEAEVPVAFHIGDCTGRLAEAYSAAWGENPQPALHKFTAFQQLTCFGDRAIYDTLSAMIFQNIFGRFPNLRIVTIELGCDWVPGLLKHMDKAHRFTSARPTEYGTLTATPSELFRQHVWVTPFFEDDTLALVDKIGAEHVLFGSDYPHGEGAEEPIMFLDRLKGLSDEQVRLIMRENTAKLLKLN